MTTAAWIVPSNVPNVTSGLVNWWKFDENTGTTAADSIGAANGTFAGTPNPTWIPGKINSGLHFDGAPSGGYLQLATNLISGSTGLTVAGWVFPTTNVLSYPIYDSDGDTSQGFWVNLKQGAVSLNASFQAVFNSVDVVRASDGEPFTLNAWTHLTITWSGTTSGAGVHIYANAVETAYVSTQNGSGTHSANTTTNRFIGRPDVGSGRYVGVMDDLRVYNRVLSSSEILQLYQWIG
jgi:hypothetical protein